MCERNYSLGPAAFSLQPHRTDSSRGPLTPALPSPSLATDSLIVSLARAFLVVCLVSTSPVIAGRLHDAAKNGDLDQVKRLIEAGADINEMDRGRTPLHWAAEKGHAAVARLLIEKGAKVNVKESKGYFYGQTPLHLAVSDTKCLVARCKIAPGLSEERKAIVTILIDHGADVNARDKSGGTALMWVAICNDVDVAQLLIDHGADMNLRGNEYTALEMASVRGPDVAILMVKRGADVKNSKTALIINATRCGFRELAEQLTLHGTKEPRN
jgi:ankyrin repeat protein